MAMGQVTVLGTTLEFMNVGLVSFKMQYSKKKNPNLLTNVGLVSRACWLSEQQHSFQSWHVHIYR